MEQKALSEQQIKNIQEIAADIQYGTITLVFQDGKLIQMERNEKIRIPREK